MIKISLRQLEIFRAIAQKGNITRAAESIGLTQSAASMSLAELELILGAAVFYRKGKKIVLNELGKTLLKEADHLLEQAKKVESLVNIAKGELVGEMKVGASSTIGNYLLPMYLLEFKQQHPRVDIELIIGNTEKILEGLRSWQLDLGFIEGLCVDPKISREVWLEDELVIFSSKNHPLIHKKQTQTKDLLEYPWILREEGSGTLAVMDRLLPEGLKIESPWLRLGSSEAIKLAVRDSDALSILSKFIIVDWIKEGSIEVIKTPFQFKRHFYKVKLDGRFESAITEAFQDFLSAKCLQDQQGK